MKALLTENTMKIYLLLLIVKIILPRFNQKQN